MIRFAETEDFNAVISLWNTCFPGDEAFTKWFFAKVYHPAVTLLDEENGEICSMLQMLPYRFRDRRGVRSVTYIYGACTAPSHRRQHRMDALLRHSFELDKQAGRAASILIPQEEWLFGFYEQFGYQTAFYTDTTVVTRRSDPSVRVRSLSASDILDMNSLYNAKGVCLLRTQQDWCRQIDLFCTLGTGVFGCEREGKLTAYAFVWPDGAGKLWAQEAAGEDTSLLAQAILQQCGCRDMRITTAGKTQKLGCIRYHDDTLAEPGYFNLLFN